VARVDSLSVDPHKFGMAPYPAGMFIYRRDERDFRSLLGVEMGYVPGERDGTMIGSRPGAAAAACFAVMQKLGTKGYTKLAQSCYKKALFAKSLLDQVSGIRVVGEPEINQLMIRPVDLTFEFRKEFCGQVMLSGHKLPINMKEVNGHVSAAYKLLFMPHMSREQISEFVKMLEKELER